jgi:alpha-N-acetylglucosaminidase
MLGTEWVWQQTLTLDFGLTPAEVRHRWHAHTHHATPDSTPRSDRSLSTRSSRVRQLSDFFSGPAFLPWHWMGNLDGWGGPLPAGWIERGRKLQHRFLARARELGMTPVLPAFAGFVPAAFAAHFPNASVHKAAGWNGFAQTHFVEPLDPLFQRIGAAFVARLCKEFGCAADAWFSADLYNELRPPSTAPAYLRNASAAVYAAIRTGLATALLPETPTVEKADAAGGVAARVPSAQPTLLAQAWMWHSDPHDWGDAQIAAFLSGPPQGGLVMLDLYAEVSPLYPKVCTAAALPPHTLHAAHRHGIFSTISHGRPRPLGSLASLRRSRGSSPRSSTSVAGVGCTVGSPSSTAR